ncbi:DUF6580 family putative transport protein [Lewinella sp. W8]|uniref:DUF6580 family putative transport protein n=1 Tax=Lewinella sp. W8 TaxID=2528208 RepID=UPI0010687939|nr:DUF6580 family putative transport protein [Lewinella sp. W8]MTB51470.1 hypothetical protein [Lewinella sp. W8]
MFPSTTKQHLPLLLALIVVAAMSRLLPHPPNFVPVGAMALFGAASLPRKWMVFLVPFVAFYLSDLVLNNLLYAQYYEGFYWGLSLWVYGGIAAMILLGMGLLRNHRFSWLRIGGTAIGATLIFFLVTNFGVWAGDLMYPKTPAGLLAAFAAGLPFLLNSLLANLLFSGVLFGAARWVESRNTVAPVRE